MALCPATADSGVVRGLVDTVDCHIRVLVQQSYSDLVGPDTPFALALTGVLTIYIALIGYQLLFGRAGLRVMDLPVSALKIGLILAFLTSWAAYQTVIFNFLFDGPNQILQALLSPMARAGAGFDGDLYGGLERAFRDLSNAASAYGAQASPTANILQGGPMLGAGVLWLSAIGMLLSTLGVILASKIVLAFLLALGPICVGLFLFESTRGFFDGWLRTTVAFALAPVAAHVFGAAMLMMLQPFLASLAVGVSRNSFDMGLVITISLIVAVFAFVMGLAMRVGAGVAGGFSSHRGDRRIAIEPSSNTERTPLAEDRAGAIVSRATTNAEVRGDVSASSRDLGRRAGAINDAVGAGVEPSARLGQAYRRLPRPTVRREDAP